ncbi:MAG: hypothetical protein GC168_18755 [Candidatus Hydrogenedens sp.]|nr:hypothetical protein [Candidatus Hydrogenedens sp.]
MDLQQVTHAVGGFVVKALPILAILWLPPVIGKPLLPRVDDKGLFATQTAWMLAAFCGVAIGGCVLYFNLGFDAFTFDNVFRVEGPWALPYATFLLERANPFHYSWQPVLERLTWNGRPTDLTPLAGLVGLAFTALVVRALLLWRSLGAVRGIAVAVVVIAWLGVLTLFGVSLFLWLMNMINLWALVLLLLIVQGGIHLPALPFGSAKASAHDDHGGGHGGGGHGGDGHGGGHGHAPAKHH